MFQNDGGSVVRAFILRSRSVVLGRRHIENTSPIDVIRFIDRSILFAEAYSRFVGHFVIWLCLIDRTSRLSILLILFGNELISLLLSEIHFTQFISPILFGNVVSLFHARFILFAI